MVICISLPRSHVFISDDVSKETSFVGVCDFDSDERVTGKTAPLPMSCLALLFPRVCVSRPFRDIVRTMSCDVGGVCSRLRRYRGTEGER